MRLNVGSGATYKPGWINADLNPEVYPDVVFDLSRLLPFREGSFDGVEMSHVLEHVAKPIGALEEIWRVCKPDATVHVLSPHFRSRWAWGDPDHKSVIGVELEGFISWERQDDDFRAGAATSQCRPVCDYDLLDSAVHSAPQETYWESEMLLRVVKPIRDTFWIAERNRMKKERSRQ